LPRDRYVTSLVRFGFHPQTAEKFAAVCPPEGGGDVGKNHSRGRRLSPDEKAARDFAREVDLEGLRSLLMVPDLCDGEGAAEALLRSASPRAAKLKLCSRF